MIFIENNSVKAIATYFLNDGKHAFVMGLSFLDYSSRFYIKNFTYYQINSKFNLASMEAVL